jgi:hypothetical protein
MSFTYTRGEPERVRERLRELIERGVAKNIRDLVEMGAATHRLPPRKVWEWALSGLLENSLDAWLPDFPQFKTEDEAGEYWRKQFAAARDAVVQGHLPLMSWTQGVRLDPQRFDEWLKKKSGGFPGPKTKGGEMSQAYERLTQKGENFPSRKAAHRAVLNELGIKGTERGYGIDSFRRCLPNARE